MPVAATFNILRHLSDARTEDDLNDLLSVPDLSVCGLQEINWRIKIQFLPQGWTFFQPEDREARKDPILWDAAVWKHVKFGSEHISDRIENKAGIVPGRYANWIVLKHKETGRLLTFINVHLNAGVEGPAGHSKDLPRTREYHDGLQGLITLANKLEEEHKCPTLIVGDFNVDYGADRRVRDSRFPYKNLTAEQFSCAWELGEESTRRSNPRSGRCIDQPWGRGVTFASVESFNEWPGSDDVESDHLPVVFEFEFAAVAASGAPMKFVSRDEWGASRKRPTRQSHPIGRTQGITAHWEGPGMGGFPHSRCARKVRAIERFHEVNRGWSGIAYNAVVCPHGYVYEGRGPGVKSAANGNSATNDSHYAVCYLGGVGDPFTEEGKQGFLDAFAWLTREGNAGPERNGHRDHKPTQCPGDEIYRWVHSPAAHATTEDDLPYLDWPEKDQKALVRDLANAVLRRDLYGDERDEQPVDALRRIDDIQKTVKELAARSGSGCQCCQVIG